MYPLSIQPCLVPFGYHDCNQPLALSLLFLSLPFPHRPVSQSLVPLLSLLSRHVLETPQPSASPGSLWESELEPGSRGLKWSFKVRNGR